MRLDEYAKYDGLGLAYLLKKKELSPKELIETALEAIGLLNPKLNAIVNILAEEARREVANLRPQGLFQGIPFLLKESRAHAAGVVSQMGSRLGQGFSLPYDTELMKRFRQGGLITVGTTATPEFAFHLTTASQVHGITKNPWNPQLSAGGSSGGAGVAVAAGIVPIAHGSDTGGSIRIPASHNGLVGLKTSRGLAPTGPDFGDLYSGISIEFVLTKSVRDTAAMLDTVAGYEPGCHSWIEPPASSYLKEMEKPPGSLRIAWMDKPLNLMSVDQECKDALYNVISLCEELGHQLEEASPHIDVDAFSWAQKRISAINIVHEVNRVAKVVKKIPSEEHLEPVTWSAYQFGQTVTAPELLEALNINNTVSRTMGQFFENYDVLLSPTTGRLPVPHEQFKAQTLDERMRELGTHSPFTKLFNVTGQPAISLPLGWSNQGLPIGMQFATRLGGEITLLRLARQLEQAAPWQDKLPAVHLANL